MEPEQANETCETLIELLAGRTDVFGFVPRTDRERALREAIHYITSGNVPPIHNVKQPILVQRSAIMLIREEIFGLAPEIVSGQGPRARLEKLLIISNTKRLINREIV